MGDVEEAKAGRHLPLVPAAEAGLNADDGKVAGERWRRHAADDDVLRARELVVDERADDGWVRRMRNVDDPDASAAERLVAAAAADIGVVAVGLDVAEVDIASQI